MQPTPPDEEPVTARTRRRTWLLVPVLACVVAAGGYLLTRDPAPTATESATDRSTTTAAPDPAGTEPELPPAGSEELGKIDTAYAGTTGPRVVVIGDSLTSAGRAHLLSALSEYRVKIAALFGEGFGGGPFSRVYGTELLHDAALDYLGAPDAPDALVVALGTNNAWNESLTLEMVEDRWPEIADAYDGSCLVVVTVDEASENPDYDNVEAERINEELRSRADRVVDWSALVRPELLGPDHIHLTTAGLVRRAELIREAVDACALEAGSPADRSAG